MQFTKLGLDYETKQHLGTVVEVAITKDQTAYKPGKDGKAISNLFEKMDWKIEQDINIPDLSRWSYQDLASYVADRYHSGFPSGKAVAADLMDLLAAPMLVVYQVSKRHQRKGDAQ